MDSDVLSSRLLATGTLYSGRARLRAVQIEEPSSGTNTITIRDGGASGTTKVTLICKSGQGNAYVDFPGRGIKFDTDIHITLGNSAMETTAFYEAG
jgi:hypothetical protein